MNNNPRDTQFSGFAALLASDIRDSIRQLYADFGLEPDSLIDLNIHKIEPIIALRAYDLVYHAVEDLRGCDLACDSIEGSVNDISDLTTFPKEQEG